MEFDVPSLDLIALAAALGLTVIVLKRVRWISRLRAAMAEADPEQFAEMPSFASMVWALHITDPRGFGWKPVHRPAANAEDAVAADSAKGPPPGNAPAGKPST